MWKEDGRGVVEVVGGVTALVWSFVMSTVAQSKTPPPTVRSRLGSMVDAGVLTQAEHDAERAEILSEL